MDRMVAVNTCGPLLQLAALSQHLREGAAVVVTSSTPAHEGAPIASVYAATKGALVAAARGWATALAPRRIRVNTLVPGAIETDFRHFTSDDLRANFEASVLERTPPGRAGSAEELRSQVPALITV